MTSLVLPDEAATVALGRRLAGVARVGDVITLSGDLGMGKTALARAFIRARAGDPALTVQSPTFTLVQVYDLASGAVWHVDAYRLATADEALELGLDEALAAAITLIEWPEHIAALIPAEALHLTLEQGDGPEARRLLLASGSGWRGRLPVIAGDHGG